MKDERIEPLELDPPKDGMRVETGPIKFGDDWPGFFFRGDDAFALILTILRATEDDGMSVLGREILRGYAEQVADCIETPGLRAIIARDLRSPATPSKDS